MKKIIIFFSFILLNANLIGINYYDAFVRFIKDNDSSFEKKFKVLKDLNITYIRINGSGFFSANDWQFYLKHQDIYFKKLDFFIKKAEENNLKIIFSMFWKYDAIPKLMNENIEKAYSNSHSKTFKFMKSYIKEIVRRYHNSKAIYIWELGNEYNLQINIKYKKIKNKRLKRKKENIFKLSYLHNLMKIFRNEIKKYDKIHLIETGNSIPRTYIYNYQITKKNYKSILIKILKDENKDADLISVHIYPWSLKKRNYFKYFQNIDNFLKFLKNLSIKTNKKIYIGEFGDCKIAKKYKKETYFIDFLKLLKKYNIFLSTYWVYDRKKDKKCNIDLFRLYLIYFYNKNCFN
jgi:hypothetical protein